MQKQKTYTNVCNMMTCVAIPAGCLPVVSKFSSGLFFSPLSPQDLKPSNLAVNEDCELKVRRLIVSDPSFTICDITCCRAKGAQSCLIWLSLCRLRIVASLRSWTLVWHGTRMMK